MSSKYQKSVFWSDEDREFIAIAPAFPGLSGIGPTEQEALEFLNEAIEMALEFMEEEGVAPPKPESAPRYSGQLRLRMPKSLHARLAQQADSEGTSLNSHIVNCLTEQAFGKELISRMTNRFFSFLSFHALSPTGTAIPLDSAWSRGIGGLAIGQANRVQLSVIQQGSTDKESSKPRTVKI